MSATSSIDAPVPPQLLTMSDVVKRLNEQIQAARSEDGSSQDPSSNPSGGFELHTRLPDGSSRPATEMETSTADFQMKLQQTMLILQSFPNRSSQLQWAEEQRTQVGNVYYQNQQYEPAMDIYLTLLAVAVGTDEDERSIQQEQLLLYTKLMNNLALCTMQLQRYQKTISFCTMALDHIQSTLDCWNRFVDKPDGIVIGEFDVVLNEQRGKLFYKRAKAYRLRGEYGCAQSDLDTLQKEWNENQAVKTSEVQWNTILQKEEQLLQRAIAQEKRNSKQQQAAMKSLLNKCNGVKISASPQSLYSETTQNVDISKRNFSTLRAEKPSKSYLDNVTVSSQVEPHHECIIKILVESFIQFWSLFFQLLVSWFTKGRRHPMKQEAGR